MPSPFETGPGQFEARMATFNNLGDPVDEDDEPSISDLINDRVNELVNRFVRGDQETDLDTSPGATDEVINGGEEAPMADVVPLFPGIADIKPVENDPVNIGVELDVPPEVAEIIGKPVDGEDLSLGGLTAIIEQRPAA